MNPKISPAEWEVLNIVWNRAPVTATEVYEALSNETDWHPKTVNTFLARLAEKGIVSIRRDGKANVYTPLLTREQCVGHESDSFLQRVFRGATGPLLAHFCERADLTDEEIAQLRQLLKQRTKKGRKK
jgi:BlaI family transcriptional regulator, penicillinase repressor